MARRFLVLALIAACDAPAPPTEAPATTWVYEPAPSGWPAGLAHARFGRAQAPQPMASLGIAGTPTVPLRLATLWDVPGGDVARAVAYGYEGVQAAVELIDIDAGRVVWRETGLCSGPIVGVTEDAIVCSDGTGVRGVKLDGKTAWRVELPFVAMTEDRVVIASVGEAVIVDAATGDEISRVKLPPNVISDAIVASCGDAGRELFAIAADRKLQRVADVKGKPQLTWSVPALSGQLISIDACAGEHVVARVDRSVIALARATGVQTGRVDDVRGMWPSRDGGEQLEIATLAGVVRWSRDLAVAGPVVLIAPLGELISSRGDRRLVRATPWTMVVLDRDGVAAYVALATQSAVLGDRVIAGASYTGSRASSIDRFALPARYPRALRISLPSSGLAVPTELRDLPVARTLLLGDAVAKPDTGKASVGPLAIDRVDSHVVYVVAAEAPIDDDTPQAIAAFDLASKTWAWQRGDACGPGVVKAIAVTETLVACGTQGTRPGTALVRATSREGAPRWEWEGEGVDHVIASRSMFVVGSGDRAYVLDANGHTRLTLRTHDGAPLATVVDSDAWGPLVIAAQNGLLVARAATLDMRPVWTLAIDGVATAVHAAGEGVLVQLEDGDAFRIAARDGTITSVPGIGLAWHASRDLLGGITAGAALYGEPVPRTPGAVPAIHGAGHQLLAPDDPELPHLWTPIPPPPIAGAGQQLTIYEPGGGVRARAEYELGRSATWLPRGPAGSEILLLGDAPAGEMRTLVLVDPRTAEPKRSFHLSGEEAAFSTIVDGSPVSGVMIANPLRAVLFP